MPRYNASSGVTSTQSRTFNYTTGTSVGTQLLSATNSENGTVTYTYGANNLIATKVDAKNQKTVYSYNSYNRVTQVQHFTYQDESYVEDCVAGGFCGTDLPGFVFPYGDSMDDAVYVRRGFDYEQKVEQFGCRQL